MEQEEKEEEGNSIKDYSWTKEYERTWAGLEEDEQGVLKTAMFEKQNQEKRSDRMMMDTRIVRRGMHRHLYLIIDSSSALEEESDFKPSRLIVTINLIESFIHEYFDQNPIAQLGIISTRDSVAEKLTELAGNPQNHIRTFKDRLTIAGIPSLQNSLELAYEALTHIAKHGSKEILIVYSALCTNDPGDINVTIKKLEVAGIRVSIVSTSAEVHICKIITRQTKGTYVVALNQVHFKQSLLSHTTPPPTSNESSKPSLVKMGFPQYIEEEYYSLCVCHKELKKDGYVCPRCLVRFCELPCDCRVCNLTLVSSAHLARSYHHLFPVPRFAAKEQVASEEVCYGCKSVLQTKFNTVFVCPKCTRQFCYDCDQYIHEVLYNCAGCENMAEGTRVSEPIATQVVVQESMLLDTSNGVPELSSNNSVEIL